MEKVLETIAERWTTHAEQYDDRHNAKNTKEDIETWKSYLEENIGKDKTQKVLDVGAGTGFLTLLEAELGYYMTGLDISEGMLAIAKQHAQERGLDIRFLQSPVENMPLEDNTFDVVTNKSFLWTLLTPVEIAKEWLRVLKPGGKALCYITIGNGERKMGAGHYSEEIENMLPLKGASADTLRQVLIDAGFVDVEAICLDKLVNRHTGEEKNNGPANEKKWYVIKGIKAG